MSGKKHNILLITTDQQRYDTIGAFGYCYAKTPCLDELARESVIFEKCYTPIPSCIPARASILTGCYSKVHKLPINYFENESQIPYYVPTFPEILSNNGIDTIAIGKMHFSPIRRSNGFNRLMLMEEIPRYRQDDEYATYLKEHGWGHIQSIHGVRHFLYMRPQESVIPTRHHGTTWVADRTIEELRSHEDRPFMIWASFIAPHPPLDVPPEWAHLYDDVPLPKPINDMTSVSLEAIDNGKIIEDGMSEDSKARFKKLYYCAISFVDYQIGRIINELKRLDLYENTLIVFTSDHGEMLGDHQSYQKFQPYESSSHVPFIVKPPTGCIPTVSGKDEFIDLTDLFPTFLDVADVDVGPEIEIAGESLFTHNRKKIRTQVFLEHGMGERRWVSIRTKDYKFNYFYAGGRRELFDMKSDPDEQNNLLEHDGSDYSEIADEYERRLVEWEKEYGYSEFVVNNAFKVLPEFLPIGFHERNYPIFPHHLPEEERKQMMSLEDEMRLAIKDEHTENIDSFELDELFERRV